MTFEKFKEITDLMVKNSDKINQAYRLGINLYELYDINETLVSHFWEVILTSQGLDWFNWFMYDKDYVHDGVGREDITASDDGTPICEDLKGLYEYLVKNNYFKIAIEDAKTGN